MSKFGEIVSVGIQKIDLNKIRSADKNIPEMQFGFVNFKESEAATEAIHSQQGPKDFYEDLIHPDYIHKLFIFFAQKAEIRKRYLKLKNAKRP